jgi:hypothetical protein
MTSQVSFRKKCRFLQKTVAFFFGVYYYWNQAGEETPTKARLTSYKTPEATLPGAPSKGKEGS